MAEALANARSIIGTLERGKSMKEDQDETIEEKHEDSSFVQTTTMTQADFSDGDSLPSWASSVLPDITAVSSKVAVPRTPQNMVDRTPCTSNKTSNRQEEKRERELQEKENSQD